MTHFIHILRHNYRETLLTILLGIICFSTINQTHDWGGDFAQYLDNARDLISGSEDQSLEVLDGINFAPNTRGAGFSLMLTPILKIFGPHTAYFTIFISCWFLISAVIVLKYYRRSGLDTSLAIVLILVFVLNPEVFKLKLEILPTFPFLALLYFILLNFPAKQNKQLALLALLTGALISIRNVGWVLYLVILMHLLVPWIRNPKAQGFLSMLGFALIVPLVDMTFKWLVFGNSSSENLTWYSHAFHLNDWSAFWNRSLYYYDQLLIFFKPSVLGASGFLVGKLMILLILVGGVHRVYKRQWYLGDSFTLCYGLLLILYEGVSGIRFVIPVLPVLLLYWANGIALIFSKLKVAISNRAQLIITSVFILICLPDTWSIIRQAKSEIQGPDTFTAQAAFAYVQKTLSRHEATAFHKPWVFHYYTGRSSLAINPKNGKRGLSMDYLVDKMTRFGVNHLLVSVDPADLAIYNEKLINDLKVDQRFTERWRNDAFVFLSLNEDVNNKKSTGNKFPHKGAFTLPCLSK